MFLHSDVMRKKTLGEYSKQEDDRKADQQHQNVTDKPTVEPEISVKVLCLAFSWILNCNMTSRC